MGEAVIDAGLLSGLGTCRCDDRLLALGFESLRRLSVHHPPTPHTTQPHLHPTLSHQPPHPLSSTPFQYSPITLTPSPPHPLSQFDSLPTRPGDDDHVRRLVLHSPVPVSSQRYTDPHVKANALLQAHFSRKHVGGDMAIDQQKVVRQSLRLLHAAVDVIASSGWLAPAVAAMEMSQMVTQGMWDKDSPLLQLPHFTRDKARVSVVMGGGGGGVLVECVCKLTGASVDCCPHCHPHGHPHCRPYCHPHCYPRCYPHCHPHILTPTCQPPPPLFPQECKEAGVETVFDLLDLEDAKRDALLGMSETEMADVARVCNRYPDVQLAFQLSAPRVAEGEAVQVAVELEREWEGDVPPVDAPLFPGRRDEGWWLVVGDPASNQLLAIKKVTLGLKNRTNLQFKAPGEGGVPRWVVVCCGGLWRGQWCAYHASASFTPIIGVLLYY